MSLYIDKMYLKWNGVDFPNSPTAQFKAQRGSIIDWGDGIVETFDTPSARVNTHTYTDGKTEHIITISGFLSISTDEFNHCTGLKSVIIPSTVTFIGERAFINCINLINIVICDGVTHIYPYAFNNCNGLTSVIIPSSVIFIGEGAFSYCFNLINVTIPDSVKNIGKKIFYDCSKLISATIGANVSGIDTGMFHNCNNLKTIILFPEIPPTLETNALPLTIQRIYVPQSLKATYKSAQGWVNYANKIVSDNSYLSFERFSQKNKEYIIQQMLLLKEYI